MPTLVVAIALDSVAFPLREAVTRWCEIEGLPEPADLCSPLLEEFGEAGMYRMREPNPDVLAGLGAIFDAGVDLVATANRPRSRMVEASTYGWVADWFLPFRAILLGPDAHLEAEADLFIADNPAELDALDDLGGPPGVLLERPSNADADHYRVPWSALPGFVDMVATAVAGEPDADRPFAIAELISDLSSSDA